MLILGLLLVAVGMILYSLVQIILQGQSREEQVVSKPGAVVTLPSAEKTTEGEERAPHPPEGVPE